MGRCKLCERISVELLDDNDVEFHKDIASLKRSVDSGCDFCTLCWTRFEDDCSKKILDACLQGKPPSDDVADGGWVPQMYLRGEFPDMRFADRPTSWDVTSKIWVSCGRFMEENVGLGMYVHLRLFAAPGKSRQASGCGQASFHGLSRRLNLFQRPQPRGAYGAACRRETEIPSSLYRMRSCGFTSAGLVPVPLVTSVAMRMYMTKCRQGSSILAATKMA